MSTKNSTLDGYDEIPKPEGLKDVVWWKPVTPMENLSGVVQSIEEGQYGKFMLIKQESGNVCGTPSHKALQAYIPLCNVGDFVKIVFERFYKTKQGTGQDYKLYKKKV